MLEEMEVKKILLCEDEKTMYIEIVSGEVEKDDSSYLTEVLKRFEIGSYDDAIKKGILRVVSSNDHEYQEIREKYANKYIERESNNIWCNQVLEKYLMLKNNKSMIPESIIPLFEEFEEILLFCFDNLNGFLNEFNYINIHSFIYILDKSIFDSAYYRVFRGVYIDFLKKELEEIKKKVSDIDKKKLASQKESFIRRLREYSEKFLSVCSSYSGTNSKLNALIEEQKKNMKFYYDNPDLITENVLFTIDFYCNNLLSFVLKDLQEGKTAEAEAELFEYEMYCKILNNEVRGSQMLVETIKKIKKSFGKDKTSESIIAASKPAERRELPKTSPPVMTKENIESEVKTPPVDTPERKKEEKFSLVNIPKFVAYFKYFQKKVSPMLNERYRKVLQNILDNENFYFYNQALINEDVYKIMNQIYENCKKIEEEIEKSGKISNIRLDMLEKLSDTLGILKMSTSERKKEESKKETKVKEIKTKGTTYDITNFIDKFKMFRFKFSSRVDERYKKVLQSVFESERFYYEHQDLIDEGVFSAMKLIYNDCLKIEEEYAENKTIHAFRLASIESLAKFLERTLPKEKKEETKKTKSTILDINKLFVKYGNLRREITSKLDDKYQEVLGNIFMNESSFYLHQDLIDEQVMEIFVAINEVCSKIALALAKGDDISKYLELLLQLDKDLGIVTRKAFGADYEDSSSKSM